MTAYSEFAVKAFEVNATDYLVKPVETDRLIQAISKVKQLITAQGRSTTNERIPVEKGGKKLLIPASKIHFIMAKDDYSYLHTENDRYLSTGLACPARGQARATRFLPRAPSLSREPRMRERGRSC